MIVEILYIIQIASSPLGCNINPIKIMERVNPPLCATCVVDSMSFGSFGTKGSFCTVNTYNSTNLDHAGQTLVWSKNGEFLGDLSNDLKKVISKMRLIDKKYFDDLQKELESTEQNHDQPRN